VVGPTKKGALTESRNRHSLKKCEVGAVERRVFAANNVQRDSSAIVGDGEGTDDLRIVKIVGGRPIENRCQCGTTRKAENSWKRERASHRHQWKWRGFVIARKPAGVEAREESVPNYRKYGYGKGRR
jgi:hypothetical protein